MCACGGERGKGEEELVVEEDLKEGDLKRCVCVCVFV
jgi:hypothetical protein